MSNERRKEFSSTSEPPSRPDVIGTPGEPVAEACRLAQAVSARIIAQFGPALERGERVKVLATFRRTLFPRRRSGRRPKESITAAHRDWKNGVRGIALYKAHIPRWEKHNHWKRRGEERALMDAIRKRERRERTPRRDAGAMPKVSQVST
jgi:hypothetical protein